MLGMVTTMDAAITGMKDIAGALGGGIREGSLIIIEGDAKSGKSVLSQQIAHGILCAKECSVAYYTMSDSAEELISQMGSLSLHVRHDFVTDRFRVYSMGSSEILMNPPKSLQLIVNHITELPERFKLVIVDSVTPLMNRVSPVIKMDFLQICKEICGGDRSLVLALNTHVLEGKLFSRVHAMSDYYLRLRSRDMMLESGQVDTRVIKLLEVTKLAGAERQEPEDIKFEIKPNVGIQILPFVKVKV
jgi:archaellum biogenesis ATPase FlaH